MLQRIRTSSEQKIASAVAFAMATVGSLGNGSLAVAGDAPTVTAGAATVSGAAGNLTIRQTSNRAILNWNDFSIRSGQTMRFVQPGRNSAVLNRVTSGNASAIDGSLQANGRVYLVNPSGIVVGPQGRIDAASFVGSTLNVDDANFLRAGDLTFGGTSDAAVVNHGTINALGGDVFLIGRRVENRGTINAAAGAAGLAAGDEVILAPAGNERLSVRRTASGGAVDNAGAIAAAAVELKAAGGNVYALAINNTGLVRATDVQRTGGRIYLKATNGTVANTGTLDASTDGGTGGTIVLTGDRVGLFDGATVDASGSAGGGDVILGGGRGGRDAAYDNADALFIAPRATVRADATGDRGDGGSIVLWSNSATRAYGAVSARAGRIAGDGGFIETSGGWIDIATVADVSAPRGTAGTWLIDPYNLEIVAGAGNTNVNAADPFASSGTSAQLGVDLVVAALAGGANVTVATAIAGAQAGDIVLTADLDYAGIGTGGTLTLSAHNDIRIDGQIHQNGGSADALNLVLDANVDNDSGGAIVVNNAIATGGGNLTFADDTFVRGDLDASTTAPGRAGGDILFAGDVLIAKSSPLVMDARGVAGDGDITFGGTLDSGNSYALVDDQLRTWTAAVAHAQSGAGDDTGDTYVATVTSKLENAIIRSVTDGQAWLGGSDVAVEGDWRWVTGPEGLEQLGSGRPFWSGLAGGAAVGGAYQNWGTNEPNNSSNEDGLQIGFGVGGRWNDYPSNSSALNYVRETNLAPTALAIDGGNVTFNANVGSHKPLGVTNVNNAGAIALNADRFTTRGNLAFAPGGTITIGAPNSPIIRTAAGSLTVDRAIAKVAGADASLTMNVDGDVALTHVGGVTSTSNKLNLTVAANYDGAAGGGIRLDNGPSIVTNGGNVVLGGGTNPSVGRATGTAATNGVGVLASGATITTAGGNITLRGIGQAATDASHGVQLTGATLNAGAGGDVNIDGRSGTGASNGSIGLLADGTALATSGGGNITVTGLSTAVGAGNYGAHLIDSTVHQTTGNGAIAITGTSTAADATNSGIVNDGTSITATGAGPIDITALGGDPSAIALRSLAVGTRIGDDGTGTFTGDVTITADSHDWVAGGATVASAGDLLLQPLTPAHDYTIGASATDGIAASLIAQLADGFSTITIGRTNSSGAFTVDGAAFTDPLLVRSPSGAGIITVQNGLSTGSGASDGSITLQAGDAIAISGPLTTQAQPITLNADRDASAAGAIAIDGATIASNGGNITMGGGADPSTTGAHGTAGRTSGVRIASSTIDAGAGNVSVRGNSYNAVASQHGIETSGTGSVQTTGGNITLVGATRGSDITGNGVLLATPLSSTANGDISVTGIVSGVAGTGVGVPTGGALGSAGTRNVTLTTDSLAWQPLTTTDGTGTFKVQPHSNGRAIELGGTSVATTALVVNDDATAAIRAGGFGSVVVGRLLAGDVTMNDAAMDAPLTLIGDDVMLQGMLANAGNTVTVLSTGSVTAGANGRVEATDLSVASVGSIDLSHEQNAVQRFAAASATGSVTFTNRDGLTVDSIDGIDGVTALGGPATLRTVLPTGDLTLNRKVRGHGTGDSVVLAAGRDFFNLVGADAIEPNAGRFLVYSTDPRNNTRGDLAAGKRYGVTYAANPPAGIVDVGNTMLYSVTPTLTLTIANATKEYGETLSSTAGYTVSGLIDSDTFADAVLGTPAVTTPAGAATPVGTVAATIDPTSYVSRIGYAVQHVDGTLTVTPAPLTITANDATKAYGGPMPTLGATFSGLKLGQDASALPGLAITSDASAASMVGTYAVNAAGAVNPNYSISYVPGTLQVTPATLLVTPADVTRTYGRRNPKFTPLIQGLTNGDGASILTGLMMQSPAGRRSNVGTYPILASGASAANYAISYGQGTLSVSPATLVVRAKTSVQTVGQLNEPFDANYVGFKVGDKADVVQGLTFQTDALPDSPVGRYVITPGGATAANYDLRFEDGTLHLVPSFNRGRLQRTDAKRAGESADRRNAAPLEFDPNGTLERVAAKAGDPADAALATVDGLSRTNVTVKLNDLQVTYRTPTSAPVIRESLAASSGFIPPVTVRDGGKASPAKEPAVAKRKGEAQDRQSVTSTRD